MRAGQMEAERGRKDAAPAPECCSECGEPLDDGESVRSSGLCPCCYNDKREAQWDFATRLGGAMRIGAKDKLGRTWTKARNDAMHHAQRRSVAARNGKAHSRAVPTLETLLLDMMRCAARTELAAMFQRVTK